MHWYLKNYNSSSMSLLNVQNHIWKSEKPYSQVVTKCLWFFFNGFSFSVSKSKNWKCFHMVEKFLEFTEKLEAYWKQFLMDHLTFWNWPLIGRSAKIFSKLWDWFFLLVFGNRNLNMILFKMQNEIFSLTQTFDVDMIWNFDMYMKVSPEFIL